MNNTEDNNRIRTTEENNKETEGQKESPDRKNESTEEAYSTQGRPITKQDRWCNRLVFIGLIGVILAGGYNIFSVSTAEAASGPVQEAETVEEETESGEPIDEELMPPTATEERIVADTLNDDIEEELGGDSLDVAVPDTATHHATEHPSHNSENNNRQHTVEPNDSTMHTM